MAEKKDPILGTEHTVVATDEVPVAVAPELATAPDGVAAVSGTVLGGRYEIVGLLGSGGMGSVYSAHDRELDENVALKMLNPQVVATLGTLERFRQEVKLARRVTHVNVARTFDIGEHDGLRFLTMELITGDSLAQVLSRETTVSLARAIEIATSVCAGLGAAHAAQVVHRDLKPDNVLITKSGRVVITDFGIARALEGSGAMTQGLPIGTPTYMAPEQVEGSSPIDGRTDIYALGTMLFEMVTGFRAWTGDAPLAIALARLLHPAPDPRLHCLDLPDAFAEVIVRCMQREPDDRYADVGQVAHALSKLDVRGVARSSPPAPSRRAPRPPTETPAGDKTIAVLPFRNVGPAEDEYLAEGLTDDIIDTLSMKPGVRIRSRGAMADVGTKRTDLRELGRNLRVQVVVEGSLRRVYDQLRVSVRIISVADGFQLWAHRFDRPTAEVLLVGDEAASAIAEVLAVSKATVAPVRNPEAGEVIDLYLRARHEFHKFWGDSNARAIDLFVQARALAPDHPRVLGGYAMALMRRFQLEEGQDGAADEAVAVAREALAIDPANAEARVALGAIAWALGDAVTAARELLIAHRENPRLGDVHDCCGRLLLEIGCIDSGIARLRIAAEVDPSVRAHTIVDIARALALKGAWEESLALLTAPPSSDPGTLNVYWLMRARLVSWKRDRDLAQRLLAALAVAPEFQAKNMALGVLATMLTGQAPIVAMKFLDDRSERSPRAMKRWSFRGQIQAEVAALLGDVDGGLRALEMADEAKLLDIAWLESCELLEPLRTHATYTNVLAHVRARVDAVRAVFAESPDGAAFLS